MLRQAIQILAGSEAKIAREAVDVFLGAGDGSFLTAQQYAVDAGPVSLVAGNFHPGIARQGSIDLAVACVSNNTLCVLTNNGDGSWTVETSAGACVSSQFLICAVGTLSAPNTPDIPGIKTFAGECYHTGRWPPDTAER
jgi:hypothetical protein